MPCKECGSEKVESGLCHKCYMRKWRINNPEKYLLQKKRMIEYNRLHREQIKESRHRRCEKDPEHTKEMHRICQKRYLDKYPDKKQKSLEKLRKSIICNILKAHALDLKDDPEHLTTKFIQDLIGIRCDGE